MIQMHCHGHYHCHCHCYCHCHYYCHCHCLCHCHCNYDCHRHVVKNKKIGTGIQSIIAVLNIIFGDGNCILSILSTNKNQYLLLN